MRRRSLLGVAAAGWLGACAGHRTGSTIDGRLVEVAAGVYLVRGAFGAADPVNLGRVGNAGFIVGDDGVIAIDTGTSHTHGLALLQAIRSVTARPLRLVLVTTPRQEFVFGGTAFQQAGAPIRMQAEAARLMAGRCGGCLKTLQATLGDDAMRGTALFVPDQTFADTHTLNIAGRRLQVLYFGRSSGPGQIAVHDLRSGVVFTGGLAAAQQIPDVVDSDFDRWQSALQGLQRLPLTRVVPGHGPDSGIDLLAATERYLQSLIRQARAMVRNGDTLRAAPDTIRTPEFEAWDQYETIHRRNASIAYLRAERDLLMQ